MKLPKLSKLSHRAASAASELMPLFEEKQPVPLLG